MNADDFDRDPAVTLQLRSYLRPPADAAYWDGLEARIMERVLADGAASQRAPSPTGSLPASAGWWEPLAQWTRIGSVVAAAVLAMTVWGLWRTSGADNDQLAYEAAVEALSVPLDSVGRPVTDAKREKTVPDLFRY